MFSNLSDFLKEEAPLRIDASGQCSEHHLRVAAVFLLVEMARANEEFAAEEIQQIIEILNNEFDATNMQAGSLIEVADALHNYKGTLSDAINQLNQCFSDSQRQRILELLWRVALADDKIDRFEVVFGTHIRAALKLSLEQGVAARVNAERAM